MQVSVVIPAFNRIKPLRYTLESVRRAIAGLHAEVLLIDDGSIPPLSQQIETANFPELKILKQENQGSIAARMHGLRNAQGKFVLFLDSDDLIYPDKLLRHVTDMSKEGAEISYCDPAKVVLSGSYDELSFQELNSLPVEFDSTRLLLQVQPPPHCLMYDCDYLLRSLKTPCVPVSRIFDSVGDVWLAYNLAAYPARVVKIDKTLSATGEHVEERYTHHWELLGIDALILVLAYLELTQRRNLSSNLRRIIGECAFVSWRKLPNHFNQKFEDRMLSIWEKCSGMGSDLPGGSGYQFLARILGPIRAAKLLKFFQNEDYEKVATYSRTEINRLIDKKLEALQNFLATLEID